MMRQPKYMVLPALICLIFASLVGGAAQNPEEVREEFHQTYPLTESGRVSLENINGSVKILGWDRNEVKVDAVKRAYSQERLNEAKIIVDADSDHVQIKTEYPEVTFRSEKGLEKRHENPASVDYVVTIPRGARLDSVELINGPLDVDGVRGEIKASLINGTLTAKGLVNDVKLSNINGKLEATFASLKDVRIASINSVNGGVQVVVPSDASAEIKADTVHGNITNDFGFTVRKGSYVGRNMFGKLGQGGTTLKISNVNGVISLKHAADGRPLSPIQDLSRGEDLADERNLTEQDQRELQLALAEADKARTVAGEARARAAREAQAVRSQALQIQREVRRAQAEALRAQQEARRMAEADARSYGSGGSYYRLVERDNRTFPVTGRPNVTVDTFDGSISVRSWDKSEVAYTVTKRAAEEESLRRVNVNAQQSGSSVSISAAVDKAGASDEVRASANLELMVPRSADVSIRSGDGRISLEGVSGKIQIKSGDGAVTVGDAKGTLNIHTGDGAIRVDDFDGSASVRTDDGRLVLRGKFTDLNAATNDGAIVLETPSDQNANIETNAETVHNDGLAVEETPGEQRVKRWRIGNGGKLFKLQTGDGAIFLRRLDREATTANPN